MICKGCYYRKLCERAGVKPKLKRGKCERVAMYDLNDDPFSKQDQHYRNRALERHLHVPYDASNVHDKDAQANKPRGCKTGFIR